MRSWFLLPLFGVVLLGFGPCEPGPCEPSEDTLCTWGGTGAPGFDGDLRPPLESRFYWPVDIELTSSGTYVLDWNNHRVRVVRRDGTLETVIGTDFVGDGDEDELDLTPEGADGTLVSLNHPTQLHELPDGRLLLVSWHNHKLRTYDPSTGRVHVLCGRGAGFEGDGGHVADARFNQPVAVAVTPEGGIYILDQRNQRVRYVTPDGIIETVAGTGTPGFSDGPLLEAQFSFPTGSNPPPNGGMALDREGRLYLADSRNHRIRVLDFARGVVETIAGSGEAGYSGDGGPAREARLKHPRDLAIGPDGRLYFSDEKNHRVRAIDLRSGIIETVVGFGMPGFSGDGGAPTSAALFEPAGLAFSPDGYLYIADTGNHRIRIMGAPR